MRFITPEKHEILQKGHLRTNDVLITTRGNIGTAGIVPADFEDEKLMLNWFCCDVRAKRLTRII